MNFLCSSVRGKKPLRQVSLMLKTSRDIWASWFIICRYLVGNQLQSMFGATILETIGLLIRIPALRSHSYVLQLIDSTELMLSEQNWFPQFYLLFQDMSSFHHHYLLLHIDCPMNFHLHWNRSCPLHLFPNKARLLMTRYFTKSSTKIEYDLWHWSQEKRVPWMSYK